MRYSEWSFDAFMYPLERLTLSRRRRSLVPRASGRVLEIGVGTGANLEYYDWSSITDIHLLDVGIAESLRSFSTPDGTPVHLYDGRVEELPFADEWFDTVVFTLVFCSVDDPRRGLAEIRRVLKPGGRLLFIEHVRPNQHPRFARLLDAANPLWHSLSGECNINRRTVESIEDAGFSLEALARGDTGIMVHGIASR